MARKKNGKHTSSAGVLGTAIAKASRSSWEKVFLLLQQCTVFQRACAVVKSKRSLTALSVLNLPAENMECLLIVFFHHVKLQEFHRNSPIN